MAGPAFLGVIRNPRTITISGHGNSSTDNCKVIRNADSVARDIRVRFQVDSQDHIFRNVQPGDMIPTQGIDRIYQTNTTATFVEIFDLE